MAISYKTIQGNDVVLRLKIGKIVINPIPLLLYSIRAPETPLLLFALELMEKLVFGHTHLDRGKILIYL